MANYSNLINSIKAVIKQNGTNDITGQLMQDVLVAMTNSIGRFATFAGVASPTTNPGTIDQNVFFLASIAGTYPNFGGAVVPSGKIVAFDNVSGSWNMSVVVTISGGAITIDIDPALDPDSVNPVENRAVYNECQAIRALISEVAPVQSIKSVYYTNEQANAINGETFNGKNILNFTATVSGIDGVVISGAKQSGSNVLRVYGTAFTGVSGVEQRIYTLSDSTTLQNAIGVNNSLNGGALIVYAE